MKKRLLGMIALLLIVPIISSSCAQPEPTLAPAPTPEITPAEFKVTTFTVTPIVAESGQAVTVEVGVEITNVGETEVSGTLALIVNGVEEEVKDFVVAPTSRKISFTFRTVSFTLVRDVPGIYEIEVAGLTETLRVKQPDAYPRLANFYAFPLSPESARALAKWDLVAVAHTCGFPAYSPCTRLIKEVNPNVKVLAFVSAGDYLPEMWHPQHWHPAVHEDWLLHHPGAKPAQERRVVLFTFEGGAKFYSFNPATEWSTYLPNWVHDEVMSTGVFDGVFYDCVYEDIWWVSNIDIDNDGIADSRAVVKREYQKGMTQLLKLTRELLGPEAIILCNAVWEWSDDLPYWEYANGTMQENALGTMFGNRWPKVWDAYQKNMRKPPPPPRMHWIAVDSDMNDSGNSAPWALQRMRLGLAIALLEDGYFGFDLGTESHSQLWWFPEYDANLGLAKGDSQERGDGTWIREFENGVVVANPTSKESTIEFQDIYKDVTTGVESSHFVVPPKDGRIFVVTG